MRDREFAWIATKESGLRKLLVSLTCALGILSASDAFADPLKVSIGWLPLAGDAAILSTMQKGHLFENEAKKRGIDITVDWHQFVGGPPMNEAMVAGQLDFDFGLASAAYVARIKQNVPALLIGTEASHNVNSIMVRPDGKIKDVADLQGRTVGVPLATSAHYALASIVQAHLGSLREANIRLVATPPADGAKMPSGIDAAAVWVPLDFVGPQLGLSTVLVDSSGVRGPGQNPDILKKAWGYPEGYYVDRLYISARRAFASAHPELVEALLVARAAAQDIVASNLDAATAAANEIWHLPPDVAKQALATYPENTNIRNTTAVLENDVLALVKTSEFFADIGTITESLTWKDIEPFILPTAAIEQKVWQLRGGNPSLDVMKAGFKGSAPGWPNITVKGGEPVWRYAAVPHWGERLYVPGPFGTK